MSVSSKLIHSFNETLTPDVVSLYRASLLNESSQSYLHFRLTLKLTLRLIVKLIIKRTLSFSI